MGWCLCRYRFDEALLRLGVAVVGGRAEGTDSGLLLVLVRKIDIRSSV